MEELIQISEDTARANEEKSRIRDTFIRVGQGIAVTHPYSVQGSGYQQCHYCDRLIAEGEEVWIQRERLNGFDNDGIKKFCKEHKNQLTEILRDFSDRS